MSLDSDIERIARQRGRDPSQYRIAAVTVKPVNPLHIDNAFRSDGDQKAELRAFDILPPKSRAFLRNSPIWISAGRYLDVLEMADFDEERTLGLFVSELKRRTSK